MDGQLARTGKRDAIDADPKGLDGSSPTQLHAPGAVVQADCGLLAGEFVVKYPISSPRSTDSGLRTPVQTGSGLDPPAPIPMATPVPPGVRQRVKPSRSSCSFCQPKSMVG